jgi:hypothetical protein
MIGIENPFTIFIKDLILIKDKLPNKAQYLVLEWINYSNLEDNDDIKLNALSIL